MESKYHVTPEKLQKELAEIEDAKANPEKFSILYNRYYEPIFRFIYQRLSDKELAFDTTAQVFLKAMVNLHKYQFKGVPFASWLYRIAFNEINQLARRGGQLRVVNLDTPHVDELMEEVESDEDPTSAIYHEKLQELFQHLPAKEVQLIEMRYFEQRPFKEIGEILKITENNAKVKVYRLLDKLKRIITASR